MFDDIITTALTTLLAQGAGWVVAVLLIVAVVFQSRKLEKLQGELTLAVHGQYEKRLTEFGEVLNALNQSSSALRSMQDSVNSRSEVINQLVVGFAELVRDENANRSDLVKRADAIETHIIDLRKRLEVLQNALNVKVRYEP